MRYIVLALFLAVFSNIYANDTLTRAQVYNFSVGDTFDYRNYQDNDHNQVYIYHDTSITYTRYIITNIYYSIDSTTKYIQRERLFPQPIIFDTLKLTNITAYEVELDTPNCIRLTRIILHSLYNSRTANILGPNINICGGPGFAECEFVEGLGYAMIHQWGSAYAGDQTWNDTTEVIYYSQGGETWGTPYYDFPTAIQQLSAAVGQITLSPTVNNGAFIVETSDDMPLPVNFSVYDVQGKKVKQLTLSDKKTTVELPGVSNGLYVWKASSSEKFIGAGKVVVE